MKERSTTTVELTSRRGYQGVRAAVIALLDAAGGSSSSVRAMPLASDGPWDLPIDGYEVLAVTFAFPLDIVVYADGGAHCLIRLSGRFDFTEAKQPSRSLNASSDRWKDLTPVLALRHDLIKAARVNVAGELVVEFASGRTIEAATDEIYENWEVTGPDFKVVALPRGGVAVW